MNSPYLVEARNIDQVHFQLIRKLFQQGRVWIVGEGSYEGHKRLEFPFATFKISHPDDRPLAPQMPQGVPPVTTDEDIDKYFVNYIMDPTLAPNEIYKYSSYIAPQVPKVIDMLKRSGGDTNQATISIGGVESIDQEHPPCLRLIDFRMIGQELSMFVYFRSWDLFAGLPENLGGLQLLKEYICAELGCNDGPIVGISKGLHMYDFQWPVAYQRLNCCMPEDSIITEEEAQQGEKWMKEKM